MTDVCFSVERYDPSKDSWDMVAPMADKRINFGVGVMLGFIFVVGGHNGVSHLSSIERYDPHQNQWTACRPMNEPRTGESEGPEEPDHNKYNVLLSIMNIRAQCKNNIKEQLFWFIPC